MMLIKNGRIIDPESRRDEVADILIEDKIIKKIDKNINEEGIDCIIDAEGMVVSPGLIDVHVHFRDPGLTYKEDITTGSRAAAKGGFTTVVCMANTKPAIDNIDTMEYVLKKAEESPINVLQTAAITKGLKGVELTDMSTLSRSGAAGFTDDGFPLMNSEIVLKAMEAAKKLNVPVSFHEEDPNLVINAGINEGKISKALNIKGASHLAEDVMIARDCLLALKTKAKVNIQHVSSGEAVDIIRYAKSKGADIYAEACPHHFVLTEEDVLKYGTNAKMNPPLRTETDKSALIEGLKDGTINIIATDHAPHSFDEKQAEFTSAPSGIIGLETALALGITYLVRNNKLTLMELLEKMTVNPANLYNLTSGRIKEGLAADLLIFDFNEKWVADNFYSKSKNSPFIGWELYGKVKYTICAGETVYADK
ncbi:MULTISPECIES: dihydroorotase [unclassified Sedimentibacter]|uniref:dihydroorotase n=1 Tax=unclassified Sedimentibacter TaxID=2649220 RepID=UPI0027DFAD97|nr:dihydroorotase [Sedimentibacter sp. MB35-C1]WMJ77976.1 dihydroorotase [Sedimentibacter sp. MB35-C1]